eukprot:m.460664 g.460664  ORF g.460664 m.460664 type:complete len:866 (+) comp21597_c0_seq6:83-2680(+)
MFNMHKVSTLHVVLGLAVVFWEAQGQEHLGEKSCTAISGTLAYDPLVAQVNSTAPFQIQSTKTTPIEILWVGKAAVNIHITAELCSVDHHEAHARISPSGTVLSITGNTIGAPMTVKILAPWNQLDRLRRQSTSLLASLPAGSTMRVAACSDGIDNDHDGFIDQLDRGCNGGFYGDQESGESRPTASNFVYELVADKSGGVYFASLKWNGKPIIADTGSEGNRYYLHSDAGTGGVKWTSDINTFEGTMPANPHAPIQPWEPNTTTWKNQTNPTQIIDNTQMNYTIVSQNESVAIVETTSPVASFVDIIRFAGDDITVTTSVTNLLNNTDDLAVLYFGNHWGNLQIGTTQGCVCKPTLISGRGSADGHGQAANCSAKCNTGLFRVDGLRRGAIQQGQPFDNMEKGKCCPEPAELKGWRTLGARGNAYPQSAFSPATAIGNAKDFTIGYQLLDPSINPDTTSSASMEHYGIPAAPKHPLMSLYVSFNMSAGETRNFTTVLSLGQPGVWDNPEPAVVSVLKPYAKFFADTYGATPAYCPSSTVGFAFVGAGPNFNRSTHTYAPKSSLYHDVLDIDSTLDRMNAAGIDKIIYWQAQIYSSLLLEHGTYEFNPNSDVLDPNVNEVCDGKWSNVTNTLKTKANAKLGWFGRPCSHIMQQANKNLAATVSCPSKKVEIGYPVPCDLTNDTDPCTKASYDTVDALVKKGVGAFYWDSYLCGGRLTFSQAVAKKYGKDMFIMGEQGVDVDSLFISGLPWMGMQAGVWDPGFEPLNHVLMNVANPLGTSIVGAFGADGDYDHIGYSLASSKSTSFMAHLIGGNFNATGNKSQICGYLRTSYENTQWRYEHYGRKLGCEAPPKMYLERLGCNKTDT